MFSWHISPAVTYSEFPTESDSNIGPSVILAWRHSRRWYRKHEPVERQWRSKHAWAPGPPLFLLVPNPSRIWELSTAQVSVWRRNGFKRDSSPLKYDVDLIVPFTCSQHLQFWTIKNGGWLPKKCWPFHLYFKSFPGDNSTCQLVKIGELIHKHYVGESPQYIFSSLHCYLMRARHAATIILRERLQGGRRALPPIGLRCFIREGTPFRSSSKQRGHNNTIPPKAYTSPVRISSAETITSK